MRRQTHRMLLIGALAVVSAAAVPPAAAGQEDRFEMLCDRFGGTYEAPAVCDGVDLPYLPTASPRALFAGPFRAFEEAAPLEEPYACFPGVIDGRIEFIGCAQLP